MRTTLLLLAMRLGAAPNTHHPTEAIWSRLKRCDMRDDKGHWFTRMGPNPTYFDGQWVPTSEHRQSVTSMIAMFCDPVDACPLGSCADGVSKMKEVCDAFHSPCYADRTSKTFEYNVRALNWAWQPTNGCYFSPLSVASSLQQWRDWAKGIEAADTSPSMWVGDGLLAEMFAAFQYLTSGAEHSDFHRAETLVNSWTLRPMSPTQIAACESSAGASSGVTGLPCPPHAKSSIW